MAEDVLLSNRTIKNENSGLLREALELHYIHEVGAPLISAWYSDRRQADNFEQGGICFLASSSFNSIIFVMPRLP